MSFIAKLHRAAKTLFAPDEAANAEHRAMVTQLRTESSANLSEFKGVCESMMSSMQTSMQSMLEQASASDERARRAEQRLCEALATKEAS